MSSNKSKSQKTNTVHLSKNQLLSCDKVELFKYNQRHGDQIISDCYCICKHGANRVLFHPYKELSLIKLNLDTLQEQKYEVPKIVRGSGALTSMTGHVIFHSSYEDQRGFYHWKPGSKTAHRIGEYSSRLRGLKNGRFVSSRQHGFTVLDFKL